MRADRKIDTVVFDLDGTLLYTLEDLTDAVNYAMQACGMPLRSLEEIRTFVGNGIKTLMLRAVPDGAENPQFEAAFEAFKTYYDAHCNDKTRAYDGVQELLRALRDRGYALAIVSNKVDSAVEALRDRYFQEVAVAIGDREGMQRKPAPDSVYLALRELGRTRETAVYVGDSDVDLQTAANSGLPCISVLWGFRDREFLLSHGATLFAEKPMDVLERIMDVDMNMSMDMATERHRLEE
ncbi:MAG: HAD-IA family hydrolase [Roseburia sp.]|nr:HAD-IA family hydrolase [Roseburia sp.]